MIPLVCMLHSFHKHATNQMHIQLHSFLLIKRPNYPHYTKIKQKPELPREFVERFSSTTELRPPIGTGEA